MLLSFRGSREEVRNYTSAKVKVEGKSLSSCDLEKYQTEKQHWEENNN